MAKTKRTIVLIIFLLFFTLNIVHGEGLIPCGGAGQDPCEFCHIFVMFDTIADFVLFKLVPPIAMLMIVIGGGMFMLSSGNPSNIMQAKKIMTSTVIGLLIIFGSYIFLGMFLQAIGLADWTTEIYKSWWQDGFFNIPCP